MTQYKNVTKKDFVFIIDCIKALEAKIEAGGFPRGQELAEQLSNTMLSLLEAAMRDTEVLYDWLTGVYDSPEDELDGGEEADEIF